MARGYGYRASSPVKPKVKTRPKSKKKPKKTK